MKSTFVSTIFGSFISIIVILSAGASLATDPSFIDILNLCLGIGLYGVTIYFWGDATARHARMESLKMMIESLEELRELLNSDEKPPKVVTKKK